MALTEEKQNRHVSRKREAAVKRKLKVDLPGLTVTGVFILVALLFYISLLRSKLVATKYLLLIAAALILVGGMIFFLCCNFRKKIRFVIGTILAAAVAVGLLYGRGVVNQVRQTIEEITVTEPATTEAIIESNAEPVKVQVCIYVLKDDTVQAIDELQAGPYAIMREKDRAETEQALEQLRQVLGITLLAGEQIKEYETPFEAVRALLSGDARAVILSEEDLEDAAAFLTDLGQIEGNEFRQLTKLHVEKSVQAPTTAAETSPSETNGEGTTAEPSESTENGSEEMTAEATEASGEVPTKAPTAAPTEAPKPAENVLVSPNANRIFTVYIQGIDKQGLSYKSRCDVNILAVVNDNSRQCLLISTPRDYYVHMRDLGYRRDKLTHNGWFGVWSVMDTLKDLYNVQMNYYFRCDFSGFPRIIDAMGGVTVWCSKDFTTRSGHYSFTKGENFMNGAEALAYARERYAFGGGDAVRGNHQMDIIKAVLNKVRSGAVLSNLGGVLSSLSGAFETNMSYDLIATLVRELQNGSWNITSYLVGGAGSTEYSPMMGGNVYVMWPNYDQVGYGKSMIRRIYNGEWVTP